jgi:hypothetical protein
MATKLTPQLLRRIVLEEKAKIEEEKKMGKMKPVDEADKPKEVDADGYAKTVPAAKKHLAEMAQLSEIEADLRRKLRSLAEHKLALKKKILESL